MMKIKLILFIYSVICVLGLLVLLSRENIFIVIALVLGLLLLGHRELWSLIKYRRLPVIDERVRSNLTNAMRFTGIFFFIAIIILITVMRFNVLKGVQTGLIISGLWVLVGIVYLIGYHYYDRVLPNLGEKAERWLKIFLITAGLSLSTVALSIVLHNFISFLFNVDEAIFFILGLLVAPAIVIISLLGSLVIYLKGLFTSNYRSEHQ